jgi:hypothetical protein
MGGRLDHTGKGGKNAASKGRLTMDRKRAQGGRARVSPPAVEAGKSRPAAAADGDLSRRRAALLSAYYHAYDRGGVGRFLLPDQLRPMRLDDALSAIDPDHQKLALAKLVGAGGLEERHGLNRLTKRFFDRVISAEAATQRRKDGFETEGQFKTLVLKTLKPSIRLRLDKGDVGFRIDPRGYRAAVHQVLLGTTCRRGTPDTDVDYDVTTLVSTATVQIQVERQFSELAKVMDPVSWEKLGPDYFAHSYRAKDNGKVLCKDGLPERDDTGAVGETWQGVLFEQFQWNWNEATLCEFRNLLNIDYKVTPNKTITLRYSLSESIDSTVGYDVQKGGIDVDSGTATAERSGNSGPWLVTAQKRLRFTDRTPGSVGLEVPFDLGKALNYLAPSMVGIFLDRSLYLAVCADLP